MPDILDINVLGDIYEVDKYNKKNFVPPRPGFIFHFKNVSNTFFLESSAMTKALGVPTLLLHQLWQIFTKDKI